MPTPPLIAHAEQVPVDLPDGTRSDVQTQVATAATGAIVLDYRGRGAETQLQAWSGLTNQGQVTGHVALTQDEYDAMYSKDPNTVYYVIG